MEFRVAVKGLILDKGNVLLVKRSEIEEHNPNGLTLPGGSVEFGEKPEKAVIREIKEETNLDVVVETVNTVWSFIGDTGGIQVIGITFVCRLLSRKISLNKELASFQWLPINNSNILDLPKWLVKELRALKHKQCAFNGKIKLKSINQRKKRSH